MKTPGRGRDGGKEARDVEVEGLGREVMDYPELCRILPVKDSTHLG